MAVDEAVAEEVAQGQSPPTIRFYCWKPCAVSIGCFQSAVDELDLERCRLAGVDIVRRRTGGGAVYHDSGGEITYSVVAPAQYFSGDIKESYREICGWITGGLAIAGIPAGFRPINDVVVRGRKISGSAQTRRKGVLTQHGTVLYRLDRAVMFSLLRPPESKLSDKQNASFGESVTSAEEEGCPSRAQLLEAILLGFTAGKSWSPGALTDREEALTARCVSRYSSDEWNFSR